MKNIKITNEKIMYILVTTLIFYGFITKWISPVFRYIDEVIVLYLLGYFAYLLYKKNKITITDNEKKMIIFVMAFSCIGLLGNIVSAYQNSIVYIFIDWFAFLKFPACYFLMTKIIQIKTKEIKKDKYKLIIEYSKKITKIISIIVILNIVFNLGLGNGYSRFGLPSYSLGGHPTFAAAVCCCLASIFMIEHKQNSKWILINLVLCAATLRMKAMVWTLLIYCLIKFNKEKELDKKKIMKYLIAGGIIALIISYPSIKFYFLSSHASRNNALMGAFQIANKYLFIGGGFGTFGTVSSILSYSNAYHFTGLSDRWGFTPTESSFIGDGGWATEIGQFGYVGTILFILYLVYLFINVKLGNENSKYSYIALLLYVAIASTSEHCFGSEYIVLFGITLAIISNTKKLQNKRSKEDENNMLYHTLFW